MEGYIMSVDELLDRIEDLYDIEDVLYIIGKDKRWLLKKILTHLIEHREDFGDYRNDY